MHLGMWEGASAGGEARGSERGRGIGAVSGSPDCFWRRRPAGFLVLDYFARSQSASF